MLQKFLFITLALSVLISTSSYAQGKGQQTEVRIKANSTSLFPRNFYALQFFGNPKQSESKFTIRFQAHGVVAGCASMKKGNVPFDQKGMYKNVKDGAEVKYLGKRIKVAILDTDIRLDNLDPRYSNHDCEKKNNISFVDIALDRDDLIKRGTNKIKLDSINYGDFGEHDIDINKDRITLKVKSPAGEYWPTFWFFPSNSITLSATGAKQGENITEMIREFGISHGLIPMEDVLDGYKLPHTALNYVLFTDPQGRFINQINDDTPNVFIGKIKPSRTIYGVDGPREVSYAIDVNVSLPVQEQPE